MFKDVLGPGEGVQKAPGLAQEMLSYMAEMSLGKITVGHYCNPDGVVVESEASALVADGFQVPDELVEQTGVKGVGIAYKSASSSWLRVLRRNPGCSVARIGMFKVENADSKKAPSEFADNYFIESASRNGDLILTGSDNEKSDSRFGHFLQWVGKVSTRRRMHSELRYRVGGKEGERVFDFLRYVIEAGLNAQEFSRPQ